MIKLEGTDYYIDANSCCYMIKMLNKVLDEDSENFGKEVISTVAYYSSLEQCIRGILKLEVRKFITGEDKKTLSDLKEHIILIEHKLDEFSKNFDNL